MWFTCAGTVQCVHKNMSTDSSCTCIFKNCLKRIFRQFKTEYSWFAVFRFSKCFRCTAKWFTYTVYLFFSFLSLIGYCRILSTVPCAFLCPLPFLYIVSCAGLNPNPNLSSSCPHPVKFPFSVLQKYTEYFKDYSAKLTLLLMSEQFLVRQESTHLPP